MVCVPWLLSFGFDTLDNHRSFLKKDTVPAVRTADTAILVIYLDNTFTPRTFIAHNLKPEFLIKTSELPVYGSGLP